MSGILDRALAAMLGSLTKDVKEGVKVVKKQIDHFENFIQRADKELDEVSADRKDISEEN